MNDNKNRINNIGRFPLMRNPWPPDLQVAYRLEQTGVGQTDMDGTIRYSSLKLERQEHPVTRISGVTH
jgi:hypothetical protein